MPCVSVPVLSKTIVFECGRILEEDPALRARTDGDHDRGRRRQAERARTRYHQHRDRRD